MASVINNKPFNNGQPIKMCNGHSAKMGNGEATNGAYSESPHITSSAARCDGDYLVSNYTYKTCTVDREASYLTVHPKEVNYTFRTDTRVPRTGVMLVGWGGNNGSTLTASLLANKNGTTWRTRRGEQSANYLGSLFLASTVKLGIDNKTGQDVHVPFNSLLPMLNPNNLVISGWDISGADLAAAMTRAQVLEPDLQRQVEKEMKTMIPLPSIYYPDYIAANQEDRADNLISGTKAEQLQVLRQNIRDFKRSKNLDQVIVVWTANTERYSSILPGVNTTSSELLESINKGHPEVSPSTMFAVASVLEGSSFINGSPQNTLVPGVVDLAEKHGVFIGGDDFKSGQTKIKSVLVDFLVAAGIKPLVIASYNHLGNNDGKNLSAPQQFRSKEISKSSVCDDVVDSNSLLYKKGERPNHIIRIEYTPNVGDSKRALDEYESEIFMGGRNTISLHNTCEDSLLATPLILDLVLLTDLLSRVQYKTEEDTDFRKFNSVLSLLSYMLKAPVVPKGANVVNALYSQRSAIENVLRALLGLPPDSHMLLEQR